MFDSVIKYSRLSPIFFLIHCSLDYCWTFFFVLIQSRLSKKTLLYNVVFLPVHDLTFHDFTCYWWDTFISYFVVTGELELITIPNLQIRYSYKLFPCYRIVTVISVSEYFIIMPHSNKNVCTVRSKIINHLKYW